MQAPPVEVKELNKRYKNGTWANRDLAHRRTWRDAGYPRAQRCRQDTLVRQITTTDLREVRVFGIDAVASYMGVMPQEAQIFFGLSVRHHPHLW